MADLETVHATIDHTGITGVGGGGIATGTSFPGGPSTNDLFYRTDRALLYYYDGTRWLTLNEYSLTLGALDYQPRSSTTAMTLWGVTDLGANGQWVTRFVAMNDVVTTNDGSKTEPFSS